MPGFGGRTRTPNAWLPRKQTVFRFFFYHFQQLKLLGGLRARPWAEPVNALAYVSLAGPSE